MATPCKRVRDGFFPVLLVLLTCSASVPAVTGYEPGSKDVLATAVIDANITNQSCMNGTAIPGYTAEPTAINLFRAELDQPTLPGPRYMAFGPSVIAISVDPRFLAICFAIALVILVIWFVSFRKHDNDTRDQDGKE